MKKSVLISALIFLVVFGTSTVFASQVLTLSAAGYLQQQANWVTSAPPGYSRTLGFTVCTNSGITNVVSYAAGAFGYNAGTGIFESSTSQYFSDRTWMSPPTPGIIIMPQNPFNPNKVDQIKIALNKNTGTATITLLSWGNAVEVFPLQYGDNLLYSIHNTGDSNWQSIIISFKHNEWKIPT